MAMTVVLALGLMPAVAAVQLNGQTASQTAEGPYSIGFVKNAFEKTTAEVNAVDANWIELTIPNATLDERSL